MKHHSPKSLARRFRRKPKVAYHAPRYAQLLNILSRHKPAGEVRILDVGRSKLTEILFDELVIPIDSLGPATDADDHIGRHFSFDLNDVPNPPRWRTDLPSYDVIVAAQIHDHAQVPARHMLAFLASLLKPGGLLVVQTTNPASLHQRIKKFLGGTPARGYSRRELGDAAGPLGLETLESSFAQSFDYRYHGKGLRRRWQGVLANGVFAIVPPGLKPGFTLVLRKKKEASSPQS